MGSHDVLARDQLMMMNQYFDFDDNTEITLYVKFSVAVKHEQLFYSADWTITVHIGEKLYATSLSTHQEPSKTFVNMWVRNLIRTRKNELTRLHVNVEGEYTKLGGVSQDLYVF